MQTVIHPFFCDPRSDRNWRLNGCQPLYTGLLFDEICLNEVKRLVGNSPFKDHSVEICAVEVNGGYVWAAFWGNSEIARSATFKFATAGLHEGLRKPFRAAA